MWLSIEIYEAGVGVASGTGVIFFFFFGNKAIKFY